MTHARLHQARLDPDGPLNEASEGEQSISRWGTPTPSGPLRGILFQLFDAPMKIHEVVADAMEGPTEVGHDLFGQLDLAGGVLVQGVSEGAEFLFDGSFPGFFCHVSSP